MRRTATALTSASLAAFLALPASQTAQASQLAEAGAPTPLHRDAAPLKRTKRAIVGRISANDCRRLIVEHVPGPGIAFKPGVDVYGNAVAPADLPGSRRIRLPQVIRIRLQVDLNTYLGIAPQPGLEADAQLGQITVRGTRVYFNGQPLDEPHHSFVVGQCRRKLRRSR
jgi:hypothetical protein